MHPLMSNNGKIGSLLWRKNPFTNFWEYWHFHHMYWKQSSSNTGPVVHLGDEEVSYVDTWCDPIPTED